MPAPYRKVWRSRYGVYQWVIADWFDDPGVQRMSWHEKGVFRELIDLLYLSESPGVFMLNGCTMDAGQIGFLAGVSKKSMERLLDKFINEYFVLAKRHDGAIYSRRIARDQLWQQKRKLLPPQELKKMNSILGGIRAATFKRGKEAVAEIDEKTRAKFPELFYEGARKELEVRLRLARQRQSDSLKKR